MPDRDDRAARRTERFLDGLMAADERRSPETPTDVDLDPAVAGAARRLRSGLLRVHPSFRFEEALACRLADAAARIQAGVSADDLDRIPIGPFGSVSQFPGAVSNRSDVAGSSAKSPVLAQSRRIASRSAVVDQVAALRRLPGIAAKQQRPLLVGGVGVASAAISIGAVYVAWRRTHTNIAPMARAARAVHAGRANHHNPGRSRRSGILLGILGVMS